MNAYEKAVGLLKIRPHYSGELAKKLTLRGFKRQEVDEVINRLHDSGMLNDAQFAETFLANLIRFKTFGFYGLKVKLMQRGMASQDAEVLLKENLSLEQEQEIAERLLEKLQGKTLSVQSQDSGAGHLSQRERENLKMTNVKLAQKLSRKGFRSEVISSLLRAA